MTLLRIAEESDKDCLPPLPFHWGEEDSSSSSSSDVGDDDDERRRRSDRGGAPSKRPAPDRIVDAPGERGAGETETAAAAAGKSRHPATPDVAVVSSWLGEGRITPREEEREWASVTPGEMLRIESDLGGLSVGVGVGVAAAAGRRPDPASDALDGTGCRRVRGGSSPPPGGEGGGGSPAQHVTDDEREEALLPLMEAELAALPASEKAAYLEARRKCPEQVGDDQKRAFLWKENFDAKLAAKRLALHWQYRLQLFGPQKCFLPMSLSGAVLDDIVALSVGFLRILPERDEYGRTIIVFSPGKHDSSKCSRESMIRACWYLLHIASEDPSTRRRGFVCLVDGRTQDIGRFNPALYRSLMDLGLKYMAFLVRSIHYCYPGRLFHLVNPIVKAIFGERLRKRFMIHYGSTENVLQSITRFGLNRDCLPCELGGSIPQLDPVKWLSGRMIREGLNYPPCSLSTDQEINWRDLTLNSGPEKLDSTVQSSLPSQRSNLTEGIASSDAQLSSAQPRRPASAPGGVSRGKKWRDPRMERAVEAKLANPDLPLLRALIEGGFDFPAGRQKGQTDKHIKDSDNVTLFQRKNQLCRRLRARKMDGSHKSCLVVAEGGDQLPPSPNLSAATSPIDHKDGGTLSQASSVDRVFDQKRTRELGDPRMTRAVEAKFANPDLSLFDALILGGFEYSVSRGKGQTDKTDYDAENVSLSQRKNQLRRRLRSRKMDDPRMNRAVAAKLRDAEMSLLDALLAGGFHFPKLDMPGLCDKSIRDADNVTLFSRKEELTKKVIELEFADVDMSAFLASNTNTSHMCLSSDATNQQSMPATADSRVKRAQDRKNPVHTAEPKHGSRLPTEGYNIGQGSRSQAGVRKLEVQRCQVFRQRVSSEVRDQPELVRNDFVSPFVSCEEDKLFMDSWLWSQDDIV